MYCGTKLLLYHHFIEQAIIFPIRSVSVIYDVLFKFIIKKNIPSCDISVRVYKFANETERVRSQ